MIDAEGRILPVGEKGELCTRGYSVMLGYWDEPEKTAEAIDPAGWMHTGDLATIDADWLLRHRRPHQGHGDPRRRERLSPRDGGIPLPPSEAIADVQVFGVPDPKFGEELCAWIRLKRRRDTHDGRGGARTFCRGQIAHYKVPRHIRFVTDFPMTVTGKMQKYLMRQAMEQELAASRAA